MVTVCPLQTCGLSTDFLKLRTPTDAITGWTYLTFYHEDKPPTYLRSASHWNVIGLYAMSSGDAKLTLLSIDEDMLVEEKDWPDIDSFRDAPCSITASPEEFEALVILFRNLAASNRTHQQMAFEPITAEDLGRMTSAERLVLADLGSSFQGGELYRVMDDGSEMNCARFVYLSSWSSTRWTSARSTFEILSTGAWHPREPGKAVPSNTHRPMLYAGGQAITDLSDLLDEHVQGFAGPRR